MDDLPAPERLDQLRTAIAGRLRRVWAHLLAEEFDALMLKIARVTLRYEQRPPLSTPVINDAGEPNVSVFDTSGTPTCRLGVGADRAGADAWGAPPGAQAELVARLERVRGRMTDAEFDALVTDVERTAQRFAEIDAGLHVSRLDRRSEPR